MFVKARKVWLGGSGGGGGGSTPVVAIGLFSGGTRLVYAPAAGVLNDVNPGGAWPSTGIGRIDVNTAAGNSEWTGLAAVSDADGVLITNLGPNNLQLDDANAGSQAANQFFASGNIVLFPGQGVIAVYTNSQWYIR